MRRTTWNARRVVLLPGRPLPEDVALEDVDHRLVERDPPAHAIVIGVDHPLHEALEVVLDRGILPPPLLGEPARQGVVMDRDDGLDPALEQRIDDGAVVLERLVGEPPVLRLEAAPFEREAMGVVVERARQIEVLAEAVVVIAGVPGGPANFARLLPRPPVVAVQFPST